MNSQPVVGASDGTVVGAAILRHGRVLAARRTSPPAAAGRWELPGGKVEEGESLEVAAVREIAEELGCAIVAVRQLDAEVELPHGRVLRVVLATLEGSEPYPHVHDALRWLGPEELLEVPWLDADRPFLAELHPVLLDGERFADGNVGGATRIGSTVRRPVGPWTEPVHALLAHLRSAALDGVPQVLGVDLRGREVLTYLPGESVDVDETVVCDALLGDAVSWLRRFHDAVADFRPTGVLPWRNVARELGPDEIICHHDPGAYNWAVVGDRLSGVVDWDMAGPGRPIEDLAFMAWSAVPLARPLPLSDVVRRLALMTDTYGDRAVGPTDLLGAVAVRMDAAVDRIAAGQRAGDPGMLNLAGVGEPDRTRRALAELHNQMPDVLSELARRA